MLIGGGIWARPYRDENRTELDCAKLADQRAHGLGSVPGHARRDDRARLGRDRSAHAGRHPGHRPERAPRAASSTPFGFSAHGFQLGPIVGAVMAELVATGATNMPIAPFRVDRFSGS